MQEAHRLAGVFRHVALFRWREGVPRAQVDVIAAALRSLQAQIPELRSYHVGPDAGRAEGNWDFAVVADFDHADDWCTYRDHPAHLKVAAEWVRPALAERVALQYEC